MDQSIFTPDGRVFIYFVSKILCSPNIKQKNYIPLKSPGLCINLMLSCQYWGKKSAFTYLLGEKITFPSKFLHPLVYVMISP